MYTRGIHGEWLYLSPDGQYYFHYQGMLGWVPLARPVGLSGFNFFKDVCCDSGSAASKATNAVATPFKQAGQAVNNALGGTFIGSAVRAAGRVTQTGLDAVNKATKDLGSVISKVPVIGGPLSAVYDVVTDPYTLPLTVADDIVHGDSLSQTITDGIQHEVTKYKAAAPYVESIVALVPGVGGMCASCIAVGVGVAEGQPIDQILVEAAAAQIPGGAIVVAGYLTAKQILSGRVRPVAWDTLLVGAATAIAKQQGVTIPPEALSTLTGAAKFGSDIANGKTPEEAGLDGLVAAIPTSTQAGKAFHASLTVGMAETKVALRGSKIGDALFTYGLSQSPADHRVEIQKSLTTAIGLGQASNLQAVKASAAPSLLAKLQAVGAADTTPVVAAARSALGGHGVVGFNVGHGLMQYRGDLYQTQTLRGQLSTEDQHGFDVALALKIGNVASTLPGFVDPAAAAGMLIAKGAQTANSDTKDTIHQAVAGDAAVASGVADVHTTVSGLEWAAIGTLAVGVGLLVAGIASK